jgi:hypothetical protein
MIRRICYLFISLSVMLSAVPAGATIFGEARGVVHDEHHRPIAGASVELRSTSSDWSQSSISDAEGGFLFHAVPLGSYRITVHAAGFGPSGQTVTVHSGSEPVLHFGLFPEAVQESVTVSGEAAPAPSGLSSTVSMVSRAEIAAAPGASRANSLSMITDYVPGAYIAHDQLHIRGGHQTSWLIDGIPIPNTNIATNIGPQFAPGDIDYLEVNRGGYGSEFGDRTYGVFNIVPRTGFERYREGELTLSAGNFYQTNDALSLASHTERMAYYVSVNGNRSNLGIQTPVPQVLHDAENGVGGFASLIVNLTPRDQLRLITSLRRDYYQVPYDPDPSSVSNSQYDSSGLRDAQRESDVLVAASWVRTLNPRWLLTVSPFYHRNISSYESSPADTPVASTQRLTSSYSGGQITLDGNVARNHLQAGIYAFAQQDGELLGAIFNPPDPNFSDFTDREHPSGRLIALFVEDQFRMTPWLTLTAGLRPTFFDGGISESAVSPRFGAALTLPRLNWTLRGFYGHYYQAPPLLTASGPLLQYAQANQTNFVPLRGERDEEFEFGLAIPWRGWLLDADTFRTRANNFFDHNNIGNSNLFFPVTIQAALIRAWELTLRSPEIGAHARFHLAYSNQVAEGAGVVTGGLNDIAPSASVWPAPYEPLDHDQRNTLSVGGEVKLPWRARATGNVAYGSGFTNGAPGQPYPGDHLPGHITVDLSLAKDFGKSYSLAVTALNVANRRVELDNSVTFGGFHWNSPREIYGTVNYRFHY